MKNESNPYILLCHPHVDAEWGTYVSPDYSPLVNWPVSLFCLNSYLRANGVDVRLFDLMCEQSNYVKKLSRIIEERKPTAIGISIMTAQISSALELAGTIREIAPDIPIVFGGVHPSIFPEKTLEDPLCDYVIFGEGEETLTELAFLLYEKGTVEEPIPGLGIKKDGQLLVGPSRPLLTLDELPLQDYNSEYSERYRMNHFEPYLRLFNPDGAKEGNQIVLSSARGCPFRCTFCYNSTLKATPRYRMLSVDRILDNVERQVEEQGITFFSWGDEHFFTNLKRSMALLEGFKSRNIKARWFANIRADVFVNKNFQEHIAPVLEEAGCSRLHFGGESGSQRVLDILNKKIEPDWILEGCRLFQDSNIILCGSFMCGIPGERPVDVLDTIRLWHRMFEIKRNIWIMGPFIFRPYPGTLLYDDALKLGFPEPESLRDWARVPYGRRGEILDKSYFSWIDEEHWDMIDYLLTVKSRYFVRHEDPIFSFFRRRGYELLMQRLEANSVAHLKEETALIKESCLL